MKRANSKLNITHREIEQAMKFFFEKGGKIKILPQEKATSITMIGMDKWGAYEPLRELNF